MVKHSKKESEKEIEMVCQDCGNTECQCGPCESCGQMECGCEGGSCGSCGPSGGCGSSMGGCGSGACGSSGWHGGWANKKIGLGIGLIALAVLWYAKNTGYLNPALFWPVVFGVAGIVLFIKGIWMKNREQKRGCC